MNLFYFDANILGKKYEIEVEYENHNGVIEFYYANVVTTKVDLLPLLDLQQQYELQERIIQWNNYIESIRFREAA
jgi:hypothetical protein